MTRSFTLHRSTGVRVSPCFQIIGVEGEEEKWLGQEPLAVTSEEESWLATGAALLGLAGREEQRWHVLERE